MPLSTEQKAAAEQKAAKEKLNRMNAAADAAATATAKAPTPTQITPIKEPKQQKGRYFIFEMLDGSCQNQ